MKPFNLERALAGDPVVTRDGRDVVWLAYCEKARVYQLIVLVDGMASVMVFSPNGKYYETDDGSANDLFMKSVKRTVYVNVWGGSGQWGYMSTTRPFDSVDDAKESANLNPANYVAIAAPIEIEE